MTTPPLTRRLRSALFITLRSAFRAIPMSEAQRDQLRSRFLQRFPTVRPLPAQGQLIQATERRPRVRADERCIGYVEYSEEPLPDPLPATLVAFYLPQFHTIPENDEWWGKGFTEWRNVTRALPQFEGHLQPRLPGDLGFYDLRNPQVMRNQAKLARTYGLSAFCFYFYWFEGKTLLEEPLRNWLNDVSIDFQYCLCWANENWTRRWDGRDDEILIAQQHLPVDDIAFIEHVSQYLRDPRYLRIDGKPMLLLYRPMLLPDAKATLERWRAWCRENGIGEVHLAYVQSFERPDPHDIGFDSAVEFPPNLVTAGDVTQDVTLLNPDYAGIVLDWRSMARSFMARSDPGYPLYRGVNCGWDNEARRPGNGRTLTHFSVPLFTDWVAHARRSSDLVFINAWNEWAEGAVLEPDASRGHALLAATRAALLDGGHQIPDSKSPRSAIAFHVWYPDIVDEVAMAIRDSGLSLPIYVTTTAERETSVRMALTASGLEASVFVLPNRGRDVLPFLLLAQQLRTQYELLLKIHTKRSPHRPDGDKWRRSMLGSLLPSGMADRVIRAFAEEPGLGLLVPADHWCPLSHYWGANESNVKRVCGRLGLPTPDPAVDRFPAGSMYWARLDALRPILESDMSPAEFESERGQVDGTLAHALERIVAHGAQCSGYRVGLLGDSATIPGARYSFAERS